MFVKCLHPVSHTRWKLLIYYINNNILVCIFFNWISLHAKLNCHFFEYIITLFYKQNTDKQHSETELLLLEIDSSSCK